jgi:hypothetical protein
MSTFFKPRARYFRMNLIFIGVWIIREGDPGPVLTRAPAPSPSWCGPDW